jgi:drug/metabolite transporter (DMT)-like permease
MQSRKGLDALAVSLMLLLCLTWGLQQSLLKLAADDIAPIMQIGLRSGLSAVLVWCFMRWNKEPVRFDDGTWKPGLVVGVLFALEFLLVGEALRLTAASHVVVFLYTAPIFVALGLHFKLPDERLHWLQWAGIGLAFAGIVYAFLGHGVATSGGSANDMLVGDLLALCGGVSWAATTIVVRSSSLSKASASQTLLYQLLAAFVLLVLAAFLLGQATIKPTPLMWSSLAFQAVIVSFVSFLVWFWLLRHYLASQLGVFSFITPLAGVGFGVWLLGEKVESSFLTGAVLVLAGVVLVSGYGWLQQLWARGAATPLQ